MAGGSRGIVLCLLVSVFSSLLHLAESSCIRTPEGITSSKAAGDGGFRIKISGNPEQYVPGEVYTVSIQGWRRQYAVQKFSGFMMVVESASRSKGLYVPQSVGTFQLYGDVLTMHSEDCPNAVTHTSNILKSDVQVLWTAPPAGSGCVVFRAMVIEQREVWYMDDGELTKELCEEVQENEDMQPEVIHDCCACDEAKYEVTFEGHWSRQTHPKDFPSNEWLTHFSDIIGASHSNDYRVWKYGGYASDGLRQLAEWGSTRALESELKKQSSHIRTIIKARGLWYPNVNGKTFAVFRVDNQHHLMSLVSMLGPTPDWIVGVSALELCLKNCTWVDQKVLNLYPWDAGTDSGVTYMSNNKPTIPRQKIRRITNSYPNDPKSPFYDPTGLPMKPLARLTITKQRVYEKPCDAPPFTEDLVEPIEEAETDTDTPECAVSDWSEFSPCSVTCGKGIRTRNRHYLIPMKADMFQCDRQLESKEMCAADVPICEGGNSFDIFGEGIYGSQGTDPVCATTDWSLWSVCSATCGTGYRTRTRKYLNRMGRKKCNEELKQQRECEEQLPPCQEEEIDPSCAVTQWTDWSPCSVTCGEGVKVRTRYFLVPTADQSSCQVNTMEKASCEGERRSCAIDEVEAKEVCMQEKKVGACRGYFPRYYYDAQRGMCLPFTYGGCRGNRNNFETYDECAKTCEFKRISLSPSALGGTHSIKIAGQPDPYKEFQKMHAGYGPSVDTHERLTPESLVKEPVDCIVSDWSDWEPCTPQCGKSWKKKMMRQRTIQVHPQNGGKKCPKLIKKKKCHGHVCTEEKEHRLESESLILDPYYDFTSPIMPPSSQMNALLPMPHIELHRASQNRDEELLEEMEGANEKQDCQMGEWGPWSPCTLSCGTESLQQRIRSIVSLPRGGGAPCGPRLERRYCTLPPCPIPPYGTW